MSNYGTYAYHTSRAKMHRAQFNGLMVELREILQENPESVDFDYLEALVDGAKSALSDERYERRNAETARKTGKSDEDEE